MNNNKTHKITEPKESKEQKNEVVYLSVAEIELFCLNLQNKHVFLSPAKSILEEIAKKIIESSIEIVFDE